MKVGRKIKKPEKINLVPILDSVFIFIFFLLMSAQFVDVYEIGSSLPMVKEAPDQQKNDKDPLNLTLEVDKEKNVVVKTGMRNPRSRSFASTQHPEMKDYLRSLKAQNPEENTMILKSDPKLPFQGLIHVIDATQEPKDSKQKLFEQIVFDNSGVSQ
jgi:biopolymer transport protein ExbD